MLSSQPEHLRQDLARAEQALGRGDFAACIRLCDAVLTRDAINLPAHLLRGVACGQTGQLERAMRDLGYVLERQPDNAQAALFLGQALRRAQRFEAALERLRSLAGIPEVRQRALFEAAICLDRLGRPDEAAGLYRDLLAEDPRQADAAANLAAVLEKTNQLEEAGNWAERALLLAPGNVRASLTQARVLRRQGALDRAVTLFEKLLDRELSPVNRVVTLNQLARALDRLGRHDEAFARFREANELQRASDPEAGVDDYGSYGLEWVEYLRQWLRDHPAATWTPTPEDDRDPPVFLLGFPRSGTTLLDQALAAHPRIQVIEERELLLEVRRKFISAERFDRLHQMPAEEIAEWRRLYRIARAAAHSNPDAQLIVDKLPLNSVYVQLIHRLFPEARIIFALRDPRDVCLSCYFQTFQLVGAMPYFLELDTTTRYYDRVMALFTEAMDALPLTLHTVRYEDVIDDLEGQLRAALEFLGLPWDDQVLDYRRQLPGKAINTPSYQQVSEPLYTHARGRWRNYAEPLRPYMERLQPWLQRFGYAET